MITRNWGTDVLTYDEATGSYSYQQRDLLDSMNLNLLSDGTQDFFFGNGIKGGVNFQSGSVSAAR